MEKFLYKHVIFDWNGTLIDDARVGYELCIQSFIEYNMKPISYEVYKKELFYPIVDFYKKFGFDAEKYDYHALAVQYHARYLRRLNECKLFDDVVQTLKFFKNYNVSLSILSALTHNMLLDSVRERGIINYFENIQGLDNDDAGSKIENGVKWFQSHNFKRDEILMIGDTVHDSEVARALGINCFLVARGAQQKETLVESGYSVFDSLKDVTDYFNGMLLKIAE